MIIRLLFFCIKYSCTRQYSNKFVLHSLAIFLHKRLNIRVLKDKKNGLIKYYYDISPKLFTFVAQSFCLNTYHKNQKQDIVWRTKYKND
ncbi:Uncharacterised protein [Prevotella disiens]|uniref:Uncharacterized protein n=1 Tax=Prevotella disiens TaxID=28130 RepID=A0A379DXJ7_9BACT|nr:Uncharacterised protein [Prevotella disiens]